MVLATVGIVVVVGIILGIVVVGRALGASGLIIWCPARMGWVGVIICSKNLIW